ncbi:MAG: hypothetical protein SPE59_12370 [Treponema sp.]|nr:hypothetical protein [Treponema sp.]
MAKEIKTYTAELFLKEKYTLGESPFYDVRKNSFLGGYYGRKIFYART